MTVAVLVLAHRVPALQDLVRTLDERFRILIHLDAKCPVPQEAIPLPPHASWTTERHPVFWMGYSMFRGIRALIEAAYAQAPGFRRAILVTCDSLPTVGNAALEAALSDSSREFIELVEVPDDPALHGLDRETATARHGWVQPWRFQMHLLHDHPLLNPRGRASSARLYGVSEEAVDRLRSDAQILARGLLDRLPPRPRRYDRLYYGQSWWALTRASLDLIRDELGAATTDEYFEMVEAPDEHVIQTLLGNKALALGALGRTILPCPVFTNHADPVRAQMGDDALPAAMFRTLHAETGALFARKYDPTRAPEISAAVGAGRYEAWLERR